MGPFEWLASRWTPEYEYRDRLASEVEDIAYDATVAGTKRGFLLGVIAGVVIVLMGIGASMMNKPPRTAAPTDEPPRTHEQAAPPQAPSDALDLLTEENTRLKRQLADAKAAGTCPPCEKRTVQTKQPQPKAEAQASKPPEKVATEPAAKPEARAPAVAPAAQPIPRAGQATPRPPKTEAPVPKPSAKVATESAVKSADKANAVAPAAQPIPSNCRREGDCDPVGP